jgi:hypothetical protein
MGAWVHGLPPGFLFFLYFVICNFFHLLIFSSSYLPNFCLFPWTPLQKLLIKGGHGLQPGRTLMQIMTAFGFWGEVFLVDFVDHFRFLAP